MTQSLERAFTKASQLPAEEQDTIAALILKEIEAEQRWDQAFAFWKAYRRLTNSVGKQAREAYLQLLREMVGAAGMW